MKLNQNDRRVKRTRKAIKEALSKLLLEKDLHKITIQELADTADIHRGTFYIHYNDIYDLYEQIEKETITQIASIFRNDAFTTYENIFENIVNFIYYNQSFFRMFLTRGSNHEFYEHMYSFIEKEYMEIWKSENKSEYISEEYNCIIKYHLHGCMAILSAWAENNFLYPKEKIINIILKVDTNVDLLLY